MIDYKAAEVWSNNKAYTTALIFLLVDRYGPEGHFVLQNKDDIELEDHVLLWAPETIRSQIFHDCNVKLSDGNLDRIMAGSILLTQPDKFFRSPYDYEFISRVLHSAIDGDRFDNRERADAADCAWGCLEAKILHPDEHGYSDFVKGYIEGCLRDWNIPEVAPLFESLGVKNFTKFDKLGDYDEADPSEIGRRIYRSSVVNAIKLNTANLIDQLEVLPLNNGKVDSTIQQLKPILRLDSEV